MLLAAFDSSLRDYNLERKRPRYYQRIAVNRALRAIAHGQRRILLTLATGTGKTMVALQLVTKLRKSGWTTGRMPRRHRSAMTMPTRTAISAIRCTSTRSVTGSRTGSSRPTGCAGCA
ncbi:MAG: DEAD/DEAH box helicase family protein [Pseudonocardiaceae bacterium]